jgi:hypothetical protein
MATINALSKFGFLFLDSKEWVKCDKLLINSLAFKSLKKGDNLINLKFNDKGFCTGFLNSPLLKTEMGRSISDRQNNHSNTPAHFDNRRREILKGQCLNIAFNNVQSWSLGFDDETDARIRKAQDLFRKLEDANYYEW